MIGYIHSLQSLGTVDGPGVRAVVFADGCPLRCAYCHNPDTWERRAEDRVDHAELAERIIRLYPYIKDGGVTFSGGEPCMQAEFFKELADKLSKSGLHTALDTAGVPLTDPVKALLETVDLVLLDVKFTTEEDMKRYTGGSLETVLSFLAYLDSIKKPVWIRHVVIPAINDTEDDILKLRELIAPFECIERTELLPFHKMCIEKYDALKIPFPLRDTPEMDPLRLSLLADILD